MKPRMTAEQQATVAEWLTKTHANPAPLRNWSGPLPVRELSAARNARTMGVTHADMQRLLHELAARARKATHAV